MLRVNQNYRMKYVGTTGEAPTPKVGRPKGSKNLYSRKTLNRPAPDDVLPLIETNAATREDL